ncbi:MAG TPA: PLP-dependent transferase [Burkholderiaceae bacterium]|nr:PLP-dependent transferase [Burkholderiaceae bacterium]
MAHDKDAADGDAVSTRQIHHGYVPPDGFGAVAPGVFRASTVLFENVAAQRSATWVDKSAYTYGLHGTPTSFTLEARLATLEGGTHAILVPSGLAAIALVDQALLSSGDTVLLPDNAYFPNKNVAAHELARWGIAHRFYDPMDLDSLRSALGPDVRLVWIEPPGSVTLEFPDLRGLVRTVRERAPHATVALDNTWGCGLAFDAFDLEPGAQPALGADVTIHALTKYPSGGADVMMGSVITRSQPLYERIALSYSRLGLGVGPNDVELVLRGLPTVALRYATQDAAARRVAQWALGRKEFVRVLHPATPGSPGHEHWAAQCRAAAGLLTLEFDPAIAPDRVDRFVDELRLFGIGWSWAGPMSLAVPYRAGAGRVGPKYGGTLVRLSIGLEAVEDLIADLEAGLAGLAAG